MAPPSPTGFHALDAAQLLGQTTHMPVRQLSVGSLTISYSDDGDATKPAVVCLHSGGFTSRQWRRLRDTLLPDFRVVAPDLIGYGASSRWPADQDFTFERDVEVVLALAKQLDQPLSFVGHSYGGFLACHAARTLGSSEVRSMALYEPVTMSVLDPARDADALAGFVMNTTWSPDETGLDEGWFRWFVDWWNGPGSWDALPTETTKAFRDVGKKLFDEVRTLTADTTGAAGFSVIQAPTLVMTGSRSPLAEQRAVERLVECLPDGELRRFDGMGHMGPITHHKEVDGVVGSWLRGHQSLS